MTIVLDRKLQEAWACFQARDAYGAERACGEMLQQSPGHPGALHLLGIVRTSLGNLAEAVAALSSAASQMPDDPVVHLNLGIALALLNRHEEAAVSFRRAAALDPDNPGAHLNLGNALAGQGKAEEALACYRKVLVLDPHHAVAHFNAGRQLKQMGRIEDAVAAYQAALAISPDYTDAQHNLGVVYHRQGRLDAAAACYRKTLALEPDHLHARNNLGNVLKEQGRIKEAAAFFEEALRSRPQHPDAYVNLGGVRVKQGAYAEAQALFEKALALDPASSIAHYGLGGALAAQHLWGGAVAHFLRAQALDPGFADAQYNLGLARLFCHEFEQGWPGYEQRLGSQQVRKGLRKGAQTLDLYERLPRWRGPAEEPQQEVAIWGEQGIGDQILFSTLIPDLIGSGTPFIYEVDRRLLGAYQRAFPGARFVALSKAPLPALKLTSRVLLAGSLPGLFRRSRESFSRQPQRLLSALPQRVAHYRSELDKQGPAPKVALSWRSRNPAVRLGPRKSVPLMEFTPLLKLPGVHFVDVQYGDTTAERAAAEQATGSRLLRFGEVDHHNDLEELLAILEACDLLITTSNATAHFAGALGKRTWLLYLADRAPLYYWAHGGSYRSLWYPAVEIVTAPQLDEWPALTGHAAAKLALELT